MLIQRIIIITVIALLLASCKSDSTSYTKDIRFTEVLRPYNTISPAIQDILNSDGKTRNSKVEKLLFKAEKEGLPLVEEDILDADYKYVTFLYPNAKENAQISFEVKGIYSDYRLGDMNLRNLGESNLFYRSYKVPSDICFSYRFIIEDTITGEKYKEYDKFNPNTIPTNGIQNYTFSVLDLSEINNDLNLKKHFDCGSQIDTMQYTDKVVNKERNIYIYLPPDYDKRSKAYPVIYLFDAFMYLHRVEVPNILDNLILEEKIEPMVAVFFGTYRSTRGTILPLNEKFKNEFINVFLPIIRNNYNVSTQRNENLIGGLSYGGLAAGYIAFHHPDVFGQVLSQSGSFWRGEKLEDAGGEWIRGDWLIEKFIIEKRKDIKLFLDWGLQENFVLGSNRRFVRVLKDKCYNYKFMEFNGWHDWANSRKTFVEGLIYLLND
jgi:enterochelin esterase-like enzyme